MVDEPMSALVRPDRVDDVLHRGPFWQSPVVLRIAHTMLSASLFLRKGQV